jgi:CheY-like chemotaxis protein
VERNGNPKDVASVDGQPRTNLGEASIEFHATELLTTIRDLLTAAQQQHQLAEAIATRLFGGPANRDDRPLGRRVLVVDDLHDNRLVAAAVLENSGFETITASNGLDAVIAAHCTRPAVILMDLTMPVLDGLEAARLIKASSATSEARLLAYTARPDVVDVSRLKLFAGVLTKPASPEAIVRAVHDTLDGGPASVRP